LDEIIGQLEVFMPNLNDNLPVVSVIVLNYNYGAFLSECIGSIELQTYKPIEIIIVDNCSTDDSKDVISTLLRQNPDLIKSVLRTSNDGQSAACIDGFKASKGEYVVFIDADDYLLPASIETHVWVHLSSRIPVGLTSADMMQTINDQVVVGTRQEVSNFVLRKQAQNSSVLRPLQAFDEAAFPTIDAALKNDAYYVPPWSANWVWAPTSGNCFRRDAINLFISDPELPALRLETDGYLITGISCMTGSILIDRPLAVYRMHGRNRFSKHPQMNQIVAHEKGGPNGQLARQMLLSYFIKNSEFFLAKMPFTSHFRRTIEEIGWHIARNGKPFYLTRFAYRHFKQLSASVGTFRLAVWMIGWGVRAI
jgi:glycosyltransferase involved in cell wall biosynthesis